MVRMEPPMLEHYAMKIGTLSRTEIAKPKRPPGRPRTDNLTSWDRARLKRVLKLLERGARVALIISTDDDFGWSALDVRQAMHAERVSRIVKDRPHLLIGYYEVTMGVPIGSLKNMMAEDLEAAGAV